MRISVAQITTFQDNFLRLSTERTNFCLGIDPSKEILREWGLRADLSGLEFFCQRMLEAANGSVSVCKPQSAFFEQFGPAGLSQLIRLSQGLRDQGSLFLLDCKRSDMGPTMAAYAEAYLGEESPFHVDAMTVVPYLGFGSLLPVLTKAVKVGAGIFIVVRSSNPEGGDLQRSSIKKDLTLADHLAREITDFNTLQGTGIGAIGAVMGATIEKRDELTVASLPRSLLLVPGIGAQGATIDDAARAFGPAFPRTILSVSRGITRHGPSLPKLREAIRKYQDSTRNFLPASQPALC